MQHGLRDDNHTHLFCKERRGLKVHVKVFRDKLIEFSNNAILLGLVACVTSSMPGADFPKIFGIGFTEMRWTNPYLIEGTEVTTKFVEVLTVLAEWVWNGCGHRHHGTCT